ncbi:MAG: hypothetical protein II248_03825 [Paludibacteraceae bacterium]|jgi:hypothetical protein|nr:hypothetical protein [Paludibacteraceae bacterium]
MKKSIINITRLSLFLVVGSLVFTACTPPAVEAEELFLTEEQAQDMIAEGTILTLQEFKDTYMTEKGNYLSDTSLYRTRATKDGVNYLFSIDTISKSEKPIYIRGRITTDDQGGNFYKSLCIQQIVDGKQQALRLSVDLGSANGLYQIGQEILIRVDGLAIGRYANQPQLCMPSYNNNIYANNAEQKIGWAPGRIPAAIFKARTYCIGLPDMNKLVYDELNIKDFTSILNLQEARNWDAKLVRIKNVHYTGYYFTTSGTAKCTTGDPEDDTNANVFAPTTTNIGYPQTRIIEDAAGNKTGISSSEYAKFAHFYLPGADQNGIDNCKNYVGDVEGILGFYNDNAKYDPAYDDWSITIRDLDDLQLKDANGQLWPRVEYKK